MNNSKELGQSSDVPVVSWFRALGEQTQAFTINQRERTLSRGGEGFPWDEIITLATNPGGRRVTLLVCKRVRVTPQIAVGLLAKMSAAARGGSPVLCSPGISPRVAQMCWENGIGYLDEAGNCRLFAPGLYLQVSGRPNTRPDTRPVQDPFANKSSRIVRVLLEEPCRGWQVQELAAEAGVSLGLASKVKAALVQEAFVEERNRQIHVRDATALLEAWRVKYKPMAEIVRVHAMTKPKETEDKVVQWCRANEMEYALTQLSGAWRVAPMVRYERSTIYLANPLDFGALEDLLTSIDARRVETGNNLAFWLTQDPAVFYRKRVVGDVSVVSPLQLYLDLQSVSGRGQEAAQEIFERAMRPSFARGT